MQASGVQAPIKDVSTAEDAVKKPTIYIGVDTEFRAYSDDNACPPLACFTWYVRGDASASIAGRDRAGEIFAALIDYCLANNVTIVGHHLAADTSVMMAEYPWLTPRIFEMYDRGLFEDTLLCEKLDDIARGQYNNEAKGKFVNGKLIGYGLDDVALHRLGITVRKDDESTWRARFGELIPYPIETWPTDAVHYALLDAKITHDVRDAQEQAEHDDPAGTGYYVFADAPAQARAGFALQLMRIKGIRTDPIQTERIKNTLRARIERVEGDLIEIGFIRPGYFRPRAKDWKPPSKDTKAIKAHIANVAAIKGIEPKKTESGELSMDAEAIELLGDPMLTKLLDRNRAEKLLGYTTIMAEGYTHAIHSEPNTLVANGRISWGSDSPDGASSPRTVNLTNLPTEPGIRECYVPRTNIEHATRYLVPIDQDDGNVFWACDYGTLELCTVAQCCIDWFGHSRLAELLNAGTDLHSMLGSMILNITYEEFLARKKTGDKLIKAVRELAKRANFGLWGGMGIDRFLSTCRDLEHDDPSTGFVGLRTLGIVLSREFVKHLKSMWLAMYPETGDWFSMAKQVSEGSAQIVQFISKRLRGGLAYTDAANAPFSGRAADGAKHAMYCIQRECFGDPTSVLFGSFMVAFIHDEFFGECKRKLAHIVVPRVRHIATAIMQKYCPDIHIKMSMACSLRWRKDAQVYFVCPQCGTGSDEETCACGATGHLRPWEESPRFKQLLQKGEVFA